MFCPNYEARTTGSIGSGGVKYPQSELWTYTLLYMFEGIDGIIPNYLGDIKISVMKSENNWEPCLLGSCIFLFKWFHFLFWPRMNAL